MSYICISNLGVTDPRSFMLLGVTSARGEEGKIGQFGSGSKHGVLIALRSKLKIVITSGEQYIQPYVESEFINNTLFSRVYYRICGDARSNRACIEKSSMTLSFGELDWEKDLQMMLREFVSNALDAVEQDWNKISVFKTETVETKQNETRVYIECTDDLLKAYSTITGMFLHARKLNKESLIEIPKEERGRPAKFYRRGVFICSGEKPALFDYNFDDEVKIDESRKMTMYDLIHPATRLLNKSVEAYVKILEEGLKGVECWEHGFSYYYLQDEIIRRAFCTLYPDENVIVSDSPFMIERAIAKGHKNIVLFPPSMRTYWEAIKKVVKSVYSILDENVEKFVGIRELQNPLVDKIITALTDIEMWRAKTKPKVFIYTAITDGSKSTVGYCGSEGIYICEEHWNTFSTILHELIHWNTKAQDCTFDYQEYAVQVAAKMLSLII